MDGEDVSIWIQCMVPAKRQNSGEVLMRRSDRSGVGAFKIRVLRTIIWVALFIIISFSGFQILRLVTGTSNPMLVVISGSMEPFLYRGDIIFIQRMEPESLGVGDVIVFIDPYSRSGACRRVSPIAFILSEEEPCRVVHRIIEVSDAEGEVAFKTKGDNNALPDNWKVTEELYEGKYLFHIPLLGHITLLLQPPYNYLVIVLLLVIIIITDLWPLRQEKEEDLSTDSDRENP
ncbi:MAG: signal peptidase I [Nitrososphaeria archaeon]|nr:signal peptidase I [Nitrososphaeria archaeon]NIQ32185.1 signal peptidase I [Nitrososphaeria archaeon]